MHYFLLLVISTIITGVNKVVNGEIFQSSIIQKDSDKYSIQQYQNINIHGHRLFNKNKNKVLEQHNKLKLHAHKLEILNLNYSLNGTRFHNRSLNYPNSYISYTYSENDMKESAIYNQYHNNISINRNNTIVPMIDLERNSQSTCSFIGANCQIERSKYFLVKKYINPNDSVLEVGASYGLTSCIIAKQLNNSGKLVSVEPDHRIWNLLDQNRLNHHCLFWLLQGIIGNKHMSISIKNDKNIENKINNNSKRFYTLDEIQNLINITFNSIVIDCDRCINTLFLGNNKTFKELIKNIYLIIFKVDMSLSTATTDCIINCIDYDIWIDTFKMIGFKIKEQNNVYNKIKYYVLQR